MEPILTSFAISIGTNAAIEAIVRHKIQCAELKEADARALLKRNEMFVDFEKLLKPHVDEVFSQFEVAKDLNDFLLSESARKELSTEIRRQAAESEWSRQAAISALTVPEDFGLMPELEKFVDGLINAVQRTIARDQIRWNEAIIKAIGKILVGIDELKEGQADIDEKSDAILKEVHSLGEQRPAINLSVTQNQTNVFMGPSIPESLSDELAAERNQRLDEIQDLLRRGRSGGAEARLRELRNTRSWEHLPTKVKVRALRMHAGLALSARDDAVLAEELLDEANKLDPGAPSPFHQALLLLHKGKLDEALREVSSPSKLDEWHLKTAILINLGKPQEAIDLMSKSAFDSNAETFRLRAIAQLILKKPSEAKRHVDEALEASPEWFSVRETAGKVYFYSAITTTSPEWGLWEAPPPTRLEFVKLDPESQQSLQKAEAIFNGLASTEGVAERARLQMRIWRMGCLFNMPERRAEAERLCISLLEEARLSFPVIAWAIEKGVDFDHKSVLEVLEQAISESPDIPHIQTRFFLLCSQHNYEEAGKLLDKFRHLYEESLAFSAWASQRIQIATLNGETTLRSELLAQDTAGELKGVAAQVQGRKDGWSPDVLLELDHAFQESQRPEDLFAACEAHWFARDFQFILQHTEQLLAAFPTEATLRLVLDSAFRSGDPKLCHTLTEKHQALLSGGIFSGSMRRLRSRCLYLLGRFSDAREELRQIQTDEISSEDKFHLFDTQLKSGDPHGAIITARELLGAQDLTVDGLIHIAERVRPEDMHLAREAFRRAEAKGIDNPITAARAVYVGFRLGEDDRLKEVLRLATEGAGAPGAPMQAVNLEQILGIMTDNRAAEEEREREYREGRIPIHLLASMVGNPLSFLVWLAPENCRKSKQPLSRHWSLRIQHGTVRKSRIRNIEAPTGGMFLDVTSLLLMHELDLLRVVEQNFSPLLISSSVLAWLDEEIATVTGYQLSRETAQRHANSIIDSGLLEIIDVEFLEPIDDYTVGDQMGDEWSRLAKQAINQDGWIVAFIPPMKSGITGEPADLPDNVRSLVCDAASICNALHAAGRLSAQEIEEVLEKLGTPQTEGASMENDESDSEDEENSSEEAKSPHPTVILREGQTIVLQTGQLEQLAYAGALGPLVSYANVVVGKDEVGRIKEALVEFDIRRRAHEKLKHLRQHIRLKIEGNIYSELSVDHLGAEELPKTQRTLIRCLKDAVDTERTDDIWTCIDDRMLGRFKKVGRSPIVGTIDLLEFLGRRGALSRTELLNIHHRLRLGNVRYLNTTAEELIEQLGRTQIQNGSIVETVELATIRKYFAGCLADEASLQRLPADHPRAKVLSEALFLMRQYNVVLETIRSVWGSADLSKEKQSAYSEWLLESLWFDSVGLPALITEFQGSDKLVGLALSQIFSIGFHLPGVFDDGGRAKQFWHWLFSRIGIEPSRWNSVLESVKKGIFEVARNSGSTDKLFIFGVMHSSLTNSVPRILLPALSLSEEESRILKAEDAKSIELGPHTFSTNLFGECCEKALDGQESFIETQGSEPKKFKMRIEESGADEEEVLTMVFEPECGGKSFRLSNGMLCLLQRDSERRKHALQKLRQTLDLSREESTPAFEVILSLSEPGSRIEAYTELENKAFTKHLRVIAFQLGGSGHLNLETLRPKGVEMILHHLRLKKGLMWPQLCETLGQGAQTLLKDEGFQEAFFRFSSLPFPLPENIREAYSSLKAEERAEFAVVAGNVVSNPLLALHTASVLLEGDANERAKGLELLCGVSQNESFEMLKYFGHVLRWAFSCLCHDQNGDFETLDYVLAAWIYTGRLDQIPRVPRDLDGAGSYFKSNTPTAAKFAFSPGLLRGDSRIHPLWFEPVVLQLGGVSQLLPPDTVPHSIAERIGNALYPLCFPIVELPELPSILITRMGGNYSQATESYLETDRLSRLAKLPGLEHLEKAIDPARGEELVSLLERLKNFPSNADHWLLVTGIIGKSALTPQQVDLLVDAIKEIRFGDVAESPNQVTGIGMAVFELAQLPELKRTEVDWQSLLESFGDVVLSRDFSGSDRAIEVFINASYCVGVSPDASEEENVNGFVNAVRPVIGKRTRGMNLLRQALFRIASRQSSGVSAPLWQLINESREFF